MKISTPEILPIERENKIVTIDVNKLNVLNPFDEAILK